MTKYINADSLKIQIACVYGSNPKYLKWLNDAPAADVVPVRHGKWIYGEDRIAMCDGYRCSNCGYFVPWDYQHKFISYIEEYKYCPNCGARMDYEKQHPQETDL